jgi:hypothetical protein
MAASAASEREIELKSGERERSSADGYISRLAADTLGLKVKLWFSTACRISCQSSERPTPDFAE